MIMGDVNVQRLLISIVVMLVVGISIGGALGYLWWFVEKRAIEANREHTDGGSTIAKKHKETDDES
jgi:flagellar basal body-associated protein FliL